MLSMIGALLSGTFMLLIKAIAIIGTGFFLSIGFFAGSVASVKTMTALGKTKEKGNEDIQTQRKDTDRRNSSAEGPRPSVTP